MKILLVSDNTNIFYVTKKIAEGWFELIWSDYSELKKNKLPDSDAIIIEFDKNKLNEGIFQIIVEVKCKSNSTIPILIIFKGRPQEIYMALKAGAYDYILSIENEPEYKKKIKDIILWVWYQKRYGIKKD